MTPNPDIFKPGSIETLKEQILIPVRKGKPKREEHTKKKALPWPPCP